MSVRVLAARLVHVYTALGLPVGFLALVAAADGRARDMFLLLALACAVDATDGMLARRFDVARWTPDFDGRKLDDIIDYINYVLVPMFFVWHSGMVSRPGLPLIGLVLVASGYAFCRRDTPTSKASFTGFPSYWNVLVLYLYLARLDPSISAGVLLFFVVLVFTPVEYVSPFLPPLLRPLNIVLVIVWFVTLALLFMNFEEPDPLTLRLSLVFPVFHIALSHYAYARARRERRLT